MSPSCLVTSTPDFQLPQETRPFLVAATALPDTRQIVGVDTQTLIASPSIDFTADVVSEDDGNPVHFQLYIDYGSQNVAGQPFLWNFQDTAPLPASTMSDTNRPSVTASWYPREYNPGLGCHTVTLIASHAFDDASGCPVCRNDSSQLTWQVYLYDSSTQPSTPLAGCANPSGTLTTCQDVAEQDAGYVCGAGP